MEFISILIILFFVFIIQVALLRWIFRVDHIVILLEKTVTHLEDIKKQNNILIRRNEEIIGLLEADIES